MAGSLNKITLIGNLGKDPEIKTTQSGKEIANFSLACGESWTDKETGERKDKTEWISCVVFSDPLVKVIKQYVKKGSKIYIEGSIATRKYTDKNDIERYVTEVVLQAFGGKIILLDSKPDQPAHDKAKRSGYAPNNDIDDEIVF